MRLCARARVEKTLGHQLRNAGLFFSSFVCSWCLKALPKLGQERVKDLFDGVSKDLLEGNGEKGQKGCPPVYPHRHFAKREAAKKEGAPVRIFLGSSTQKGRLSNAKVCLPSG